MLQLVFLPPFPLETTLRFARALSGLTGIRLTGVWAEAPRGDDLRRFDDVVTVSDALSAAKLTEAVALLAKRHRRLTAPGDAEACVAEVGLPIVMKPLAGMASKGTWRVSSEEELRRAVA